jgi:membrane-associated phospholipid phosphatase
VFELSYPAFMALFTLTLMGSMVAGLYIFGDFKSLTKERIMKGVDENWKFALVLALVLLAVFIENKTHDIVVGALNTDYTHLIYSLSFRGQIVDSVQMVLRSAIADWFFITVYLFSFTFVLFFTPLLYMVRDDKKRMKQYTLAIVINYMILIPFYVFFAVRTPGYYGLSSAQPILYSHPNLVQLVREIDPLDNCFPSGHLSVPITVVLLLMPLRKHRQYFRFALFMMILTVLIGISVLYLGIHWSIDIAAGALVAAFAVWVAKNRRITRWLDEKLKPLSRKLSKKADANDLKD